MQAIGAPSVARRTSWVLQVQLPVKGPPSNSKRWPENALTEQAKRQLRSQKRDQKHTITEDNRKFLTVLTSLSY